MTMSMDRYAELLYKFSSIFNKCIGCEDLDELKKEYEDKIDSIRVLETIKDITALLKVLDKRGILKYNDISVLRQISERFSSDPIVEKLFLDYDFWLKENSSQINNLYCCALVPIADSHSKNLAEQSKSNMPVYVSNVNIGNINAVSFAKNENQYYFMNHPTTASSIREEILKDMIKKKLSRKVGRSWEDVSRRLELEESVIENIESKFFSDPQGSEKMFTEALEVYFAAHRLKWKTELMKALEDSRRRDLKEIVQEMIDQHNFD